tara:strand:+ start:88 stop:285 length:198 start_codon:yes stop_codon:yes gene_type:complete
VRRASPHKPDTEGLLGPARHAFSDEQILELIALAGFYRTVAYFANGLEIEPEAFGAPLPGYTPGT